MTGHAITAYRYGLRAPLNWDGDCEQQFLLQADLWNALVEIEHEHRVTVRAVAAPEVAMLREEYETIRQVLDESVGRRSAARARARKKIPTPELDEEIEDLQRRRAEAAAKLKTATREAYTAHKEHLKALEEARQAKVTAARQQAASRGLYWGHYNAVLASYETARQRALREGTELHAGRPAKRGRLVNQIQKGMTPDELDHGARSEARLGPQHGGWPNPRFRTLTLTVFTSGRGKDHRRRTVTWPIFLDRPLPEDAMIQEIAVHREYRSHCWHWHATFLLRMPDHREPPRGGRVAVNLGWRQTTTGLRVATLLRLGETKPEHVMLPAHILALDECARARQTRRDEAADATAAKLRALDWCGAPDGLREAAQAIFDGCNRVTSRALARLVGLWPADWLTETRTRVVEWRRDDARRWHQASNIRRRAINARKNHYRCEAKRLIGDAAEVVINAHNLSQIVDSATLPPPVRRLRFLAAPSELRRAIMDYARRRAARVIIAEMPHDRCAVCGIQFARTVADRAALFWRCSSGHVVDQDTNYCQLLLGFERPEGARIGGKGEKSTDSEVGRWPRLKAQRRQKLAAADRISNIEGC